MLYLCWFMCTVKYVYRLISLEREAIGVKEVLKLRSCYRQFTAAVVPTGVLPLSPAPLPFRVFFLPRFTYSCAGRGVIGLSFGCCQLRFFRKACCGKTTDGRVWLAFPNLIFSLVVFGGVSKGAFFFPSLFLEMYMRSSDGAW